MKINNIYQFENATSTGLDQVPVKSIVVINDFDGLGQTRMYVKKTSEGIDSTTTITDFINNTDMSKKIGVYELPNFNVIDGGIF